MKAASKPASPMISTICGSAIPPTCVPSASPPSLNIRFTRFSFMLPSRGWDHIGIGYRACARTIVSPYSCGTRQSGSRGRDRSRLAFINEPLCVLLVAFYLFSQFLDRFRVNFLRLVDQLFTGLGIALDDFVQTFFSDVVSALSLFLHGLFSGLQSVPFA